MLDEIMTSSDSIKEDLQLLENLQRRWMIGSDEALSLSSLPTSWRPLFESLPQERYSLMALALASQYQSIVLTTQVPEGLFAHENLPDLEMPVIAPNLRGLFRRILEKSDINSSILLRLLLQRGFIAHPGDWLPSTKDENLPEIYLPWSHWVAKKHSNDNDFLYGNLSAENWDQWYPAPRIAALKIMRFKDPAAARELILACAAKEPADKRLKIIQTLSVNLSMDDSVILQGLLTDRSQKIVHLASQFLTQLGNSQLCVKDDDAKELATELAATYEIKKSGLFKQKKQLAPLTLKSKKQQAVRSEQLEIVCLTELSKAFHIDINELASNWAFTENRLHDNHAFISNAVNTLPDSAIECLLQNLMNFINKESDAFALLRVLHVRLSDEKRSRLILELLQQRNMDINFSNCFAFLNTPIEHLDWKVFQQAMPWQTLLKAIKEDLKENGYINSYHIASELTVLGLFLPQDMAEKVLNQLVEMGMLRADPIADCLKLNTQLTSSF